MFKSGFISIVGRPNVGKSTFLNAILAQKVSITSKKPQTTRNKINGIKNIEGAQFIFVDTPGIHKSKSKLNKYMVNTSLGTFDDVDLILFMTDLSEKSKSDDDFILSALDKIKKNIFLLINKIDLVKSRDKLLSFIEIYRKKTSFVEVFPISATKGNNLDQLEKTIKNYLPESAQYFPKDMITDKPEYFLISEFIREKAIIHTREELPYAIAVKIQKIVEKEKITIIDAVIVVEKASQKGIVIGKNGNMLKEIGKYSRIEIEKMLDKKVYLNLWVKVKENWTSDDRSLKEFGYTS